MSLAQQYRMIGLVCAFFAVASGCARSLGEGANGQENLHVQGVMCRLCWPKVEAALKSVHGYDKMDTHGLDRITITYNPHATRPNEFVAAINSKTDFHASLSR